MPLSFIVVMLGTTVASATAPEPTEADVQAADANRSAVESVIEESPRERR